MKMLGNKHLTDSRATILLVCMAYQFFPDDFRNCLPLISVFIILQLLVIFVLCNSLHAIILEHLSSMLNTEFIHGLNSSNVHHSMMQSTGLRNYLTSTFAV